MGECRLTASPDRNGSLGRAEKEADLSHVLDRFWLLACAVAGDDSLERRSLYHPRWRGGPSQVTERLRGRKSGRNAQKMEATYDQAMMHVSCAGNCGWQGCQRAGHWPGRLHIDFARRLGRGSAFQPGPTAVAAQGLRPQRPRWPRRSGARREARLVDATNAPAPLFPVQARFRPPGHECPAPWARGPTR